MTEKRAFPPIFATNRPDKGQTVASEINFMLSRLREEMKTAPELAIATAYLNPAGFNLLAGEIEQAPVVRLMIGADPQRIDAPRMASLAPIDLIAEDLRRERDMTGFTFEADAAARRLVAWLQRAADTGKPRVEVRQFRKAFLHGKAFIATHGTHPAFLAGSSNFTAAGLTTNHELNLGYPTSEYTGLVIDWFDELWEQAEQFDLAGFYAERWKDHAPWVVFLRMLWEFYNGDRDEDDRELGLRLTGFQKDGVLRALRLLDDLGGVLVCDEVGLGKTFIAGEIIHQASKRDRQRVLVIAPAALIESMWIPFLRRFDLYSNRVEVVSYDDIRLGTKESLQNLDDYALVVIDEAHNLRNPETQRAKALTDLLRGKYAKRLVLLTATPVNNSLKDLETLVSYFVPNDAHFAAIGIPSISKYFRDAQKLDPMTLSPEHLFDLMNQVAVRRTRGFIKREYVGETLTGPNGVEIEIEFPEPQLHRVDYALTPDGERLLSAVVYALDDSRASEEPRPSLLERLRERCDDPQRLSMARYMPKLFALDPEGDNDEASTSVYRQIAAVALLESIVLKRLESSAIALRNTFDRMIASQEAFLRGIEEGYVLTGKRLKEFDANEDNVEEFLESLDEAEDRNVEPVTGFEIDSLVERVKLDRELLLELRALADVAASVEDPKVNRIVEELRRVAAAAARPSKHGISSGDRRKVIVFSTYTDTTRHLREEVVAAIDGASDDDPIAAYRGRVPDAIYGSKTGVSQDHRAREIAGFAPMTAGRLDDDGTPYSEDLYDLLFATDVLSEGVNLQQAGHIISVDLPWNPMRLVQRHGRIDRIGSHHKTIDVDCFFPVAHLDELLGLEALLQRKVAYANAAIGMGQVLPHQIADASFEVTLNDTRALIEEIHDENATILIERGGKASLSGEEYRRRLDKALGDRRVQQEVEELPYGSGSGFISPNTGVPGWVFCARIGEHQEPWFRFVAADPTTWVPTIDDSGAPRVVAETLQCLVAADPIGTDTEFVMPDGAKTGVFAAWGHARDDIYRKWMYLTDPGNIQPEIPLALREAIDLITNHGNSFGTERQSELIRQLSAVWDERTVVGPIRRIVRAESPVASRLKELIAFMNEESLDPPAPAKALPTIEIDDIRVVCWMGVVPVGSL